MLDITALDQRLADLHEPLSLWYAQVRAESKEIFQSSPFTADNMMKRAEEALRIAKLHAGEGPWKELYALLDEMCSEYIHADVNQRGQVRVLISKYPSMLRAIGDDYISRAIENLEFTHDHRWLWLGITAISIENNSVDFRDTYSILGKLYITATHKGIDPKPIFQAIAKISANDVHGSTSPIPMRRFLEKFHKSDYFRTEVSPLLK